MFDVGSEVVEAGLLFFDEVVVVHRNQLYLLVVDYFGKRFVVKN